MKSLKKLAVIGAVMSAMNFAKAEQKEVDYEPNTLNGVENFENSDLKLVNGQLMVESTGKSDDSKTYMFVGTNTQNFASSAFAKKGMDDLTTMINSGADLYMMKKGNSTNVFHTVVSDKPALNGMTNPVDTLDANDARAAAIMNAKKNNTAFTVHNGHVYTLDGKFIKGDNGNAFWVSDLEGKKVDALAVVDHGDKADAFALVDGRVFSSQTQAYIDATNVTSIAETEDGKKLIVTSDEGKRSYNPALAADSDRWEAISDGSSATVTSISGAPVKASVKAGNVIYYATAKKLGYKTLD